VPPDGWTHSRGFGKLRLSYRTQLQRSVRGVMKKYLVIAIAGWFGAGSVAVYAADGNAEAGKEKISMCKGCHGIPFYKASFPRVYRVPKIGGQQSAYIVKALQDYKSGQRTQPNMREIAEGLSDQDMADVAAYYGSAK
jgi:cytochrome c553